MQKTKKRLNAPLTYLDKPYLFVRVLLKNFFILALIKQCSGFFKINKNLPLYLFGAVKPEIQPYFMKFLFMSFATED